MELPKGGLESVLKNRHKSAYAMATNDGKGDAKRTFRNCSVKLIKRKLSHRESDDIIVIYTV